MQAESHRPRLKWFGVLAVEDSHVDNVRRLQSEVSNSGSTYTIQLDNSVLRTRIDQIGYAQS
jgi:hypothetical protein